MSRIDHTAGITWIVGRPEPSPPSSMRVFPGEVVIRVDPREIIMAAAKLIADKVSEETDG